MTSVVPLLEISIRHPGPEVQKLVGPTEKLSAMAKKQNKTKTKTEKQTNKKQKTKKLVFLGFHIQLYVPMACYCWT